MRGFLWAMLLVMLPAATAAAQFQQKPGRAAGNEPQGAEKLDENGQAVVRGGVTTNAMFAAIDADGDGQLSKVELRKAFKALMALDADGDGSLTLAEASTNGPPGLGPPGGAKFVDNLMQNDKNGDGKLTPDEVPAEVLPMLRNADTNGDNAIDRDELAAAAANMPEQGGGPMVFGPGAARRGFDAQQVTGQFLQFDRNGDGRLTQNEVPPEAQRMLQGGDSNGDGAIDAGELQAVIARMGGRARQFQAGNPPEGGFRPQDRFNRPPKNNN